MSNTLIADYCAVLETAFAELGKPLPQAKLRAMSERIVKSMSSESRDYHKPEHSLEVANCTSAVGKLAGIFHDIVYVQLDESWKQHFANDLAPFLPNAKPEEAHNGSSELGVDIKAALGHEARIARKAILTLFGMEEAIRIAPGQGLNEFLSALVMESMFRESFSAKEILSIAAVIEATIPFRKNDQQGRTAAEQLKHRLSIAAEVIDETFSPDEVKQIISACREIVMNDLASFAAPRLSGFITNTWDVLLENHPVLKTPNCEIPEYRKALHAMVPFLQSIQPEQMFWTDAEYFDVHAQSLIQYTRKNLAQGLRYIRVFGLAVTILELIGEVVGKKLYYRDLVAASTPVDSELRFSGSTDEKEIFSLIRDGRRSRSQEDRYVCPFGAFLMQKFTISEIENLFSEAVQVHAGLKKRDEFLAQFPSAWVKHFSKSE